MGQRLHMQSLPSQLYGGGGLYMWENWGPERLGDAADGCVQT